MNTVLENTVSYTLCYSFNLTTPGLTKTTHNQEVGSRKQSFKYERNNLLDIIDEL